MAELLTFGVVARVLFAMTDEDRDRLIRLLSGNEPTDEDVEAVAMMLQRTYADYHESLDRDFD
jgi:hypothetical protein